MLTLFVSVYNVTSHSSIPFSFKCLLSSSTHPLTPLLNRSLRRIGNRSIVHLRLVCIIHLRLIRGHRRRHVSSTRLTHLLHRLIRLCIPHPASARTTLPHSPTSATTTANQADEAKSHGHEGSTLEDLAFGNWDVLLVLEALRYAWLVID
jgi:hypothetical protein